MAWFTRIRNINVPKDIRSKGAKWMTIHIHLTRDARNVYARNNTVQNHDDSPIESEHTAKNTNINPEVNYITKMPP